MTKSIAVSILATVALISTMSTAQAAFIVIPQPNAIYTGNTTLIAIPAPGTVVSTLPTGGGFAIGVSSPDPGTQVIARANVPVGWATWNSPPAVESSTPPVLQDLVNLTCAICTLNLSFTIPIQTFGFEVEPDPLSTPHTISAAFLNGANTVGTISFSFPNGNGTARLFAATTDQQFTGVRVTIDGTDFAMAQLRAGGTFISGAGVPEPGTVVLLLGGLAALGYRKLRQS